jgi:hypothetical protein
MPFDSPDINLGSLLADIAAGKMQLPDFQREWKWDDDRIRSLLASVSLGYPVGVLMMLEVDEQVRFAPKPIAGAVIPAGTTPQRLVLDGQQRLTSLFQALKLGRPVDTTDPRGKRLRRWYYLSMAASLDPDGDREEAIASVPEDRVIRDDFGRGVVADYSTPDLECAAEMFPLSRSFDMGAIFAWQNRYLAQDPAKSAERSTRWNQFYEEVLQNLVLYTVPVIVLTKDTPKEAVCNIFEKVNTGGVPLNVFELLTATFAADNYRLKDDWAARKARFAAKPALRMVADTDFLQTVALLATRSRRVAWEDREDQTGKAPAIGCKRKDILDLTLPDYQTWADEATNAYEWAASFLAQEFIFRADDVPYRTQLVPLAAIRVILGANADQHGINSMLRQWFWCGVLGELYGGTTETRFARDVEQMPAWVNGGALATSVAEAAFHEQRLLTLRTRNSAAYKGIYALLMRNGSLDWMKHQPMSMATFFDYQVDIHHIFPKAWCDRNGIDLGRRESIINKTAISRTTNISIGGRSPAEYVVTLEKKAGISAKELDQIIATHEIEPADLRDAAFDLFFDHRRGALLRLIALAMGKEPIPDLTGGTLDEYDADPVEIELGTPEEEAAVA